MATLTPTFQRSVDVEKGHIVTITSVTLLTASDTVTVPVLADTASGVSVKQLERSGDSTVTVTSSGTTVTLAGGAAGDKVTLASIHNYVNTDVSDA